jgi:hypothetical protein
MKSINEEINTINEEVLSTFKSTNDMLVKFDKEHSEMSAELRAELSKNLAERVEYTLTLLNGFQKRLSEIGKENQEMAQKLRKDLANGETERINEYEEIMNVIQASIKGIRKDVKDIQKATSSMIGSFSKDSGDASAAWKKMSEILAQLRNTGVTPPKKVEKKEPIKEVHTNTVKATPVNVEPAKKVEEVPAEPAEKAPAAPVKAEAKPVVPMTLEEKILNYINTHPKGVKIAEMEKPLGETRMKLGYVAKNLLNSGKVQVVNNVYFPLKK